MATSFALVFIKLGSSDGLPIKLLQGKLTFNLNWQILLGMFLYVFSFALYIYLISKHDLGYIIPLTTALVYTLIFVASYFIFHEVFTLTKIVGIALVLAGIIFLNLK